MKNKNIEVMLKSDKQDWCTPEILYRKLESLYGPFDLDVAARSDNTKCALFLKDAFTENWNGTCWMNPPYSRGIGKWLKKAASEARKGRTVVCLVPSRTGSAWFQDAVKEATEVLFLKGRVVFETAPGVPVLDKKGKPMAAPFDSTVFVFGPKLPDEFITIGWWDWKK